MPRPAPDATKSNQDDEEEARASISAILKAKAQRSESWFRTKKLYDDAIFELRGDIRKLQSIIREFKVIEKAEQAEEAGAKSWLAWLLPLYQKPVKIDKERVEREEWQRAWREQFEKQQRDAARERTE
jgi:hypothetical protein